VSKDDPSYWDAFYNQKSAEWVLDNRKGFCDEASILLASLLRVKGIPVRIVIRGYTGGEFEAQLISPELLQTFTVTHAEEEIWLSRYEKIKTDSSYGARDYWSAMGVEYDLGQNAW
jgi:transglutaminase-like putative cysteine protease